MTVELANDMPQRWYMTQSGKLKGSLVWPTSCMTHGDTVLGYWLTAVEHDY